MLSILTLQISLASITGNKNLQSFRSLRALRPLRAISRFEGMKVRSADERVIIITAKGEQMAHVTTGTDIDTGFATKVSILSQEYRSAHETSWNDINTGFD